VKPTTDEISVAVHFFVLASDNRWWTAEEVQRGHLEQAKRACKDADNLVREALRILLGETP